MNTTRIRRSCMILMALTAALSLLLAIPSFAASKKKLPKSYITTDADGKMMNKASFKYDSKGNPTEYIFWTKISDTTKKSVTTYRNTYWPGSDKLKKRIATDTAGVKATTTYYKNGLLKKVDTNFEDGPHTITTYTIKGDRLKSAVTKNKKSGKLITKREYDSKGNIKVAITYNNDEQFKTTYANTYNKKGILVKQVVKEPGLTTTYTFNDKGDMTKIVRKDSEGTDTTTYKRKYDGGYLVESKEYINGKFSNKTVYKYTSKKYPADGSSRQY